MIQLFGRVPSYYLKSVLQSRLQHATELRSGEPSSCRQCDGAQFRLGLSRGRARVATGRVIITPGTNESLTFHHAGVQLRGD
ncbi:MAG: hypothetical protein R3B96_07750 [Pirellulaceae bacterium]